MICRLLKNFSMQHNLLIRTILCLHMWLLYRWNAFIVSMWAVNARRFFYSFWEITTAHAQRGTKSSLMDIWAPSQCSTHTRSLLCVLQQLEIKRDFCFFLKSNQKDIAHFKGGSSGAVILLQLSLQGNEIHWDACCQKIISNMFLVLF